jgi:hypothetical protein
VRVLLRTAKVLGTDEHDALHSLGADALEAVLGDHFEIAWPTVAKAARSLSQVAIALEDVILVPETDQAGKVAELLSELGREPVWHAVDQPSGSWDFPRVGGGRRHPIRRFSTLAVRIARRR